MINFKLNNIMANNNVPTPEQEALGEVINKTEHFFEQNGKKVIAIIVALIVLAGIVFGYKELVMQPRIEKAAAALFEAQLLLESDTPDYQVALDGNAEGAGFIEVVENYASTPAGNLASHYAGICYLHLGDFANASKYLAKYKAVKGVPGAIINAQNLGLQGDCAVEMDDFAAAVALYKKAAASSDNSMTAPAYLFKAALAANAAGDAKTATKLFTEVTTKYAGTEEANKADKYLGSME